MMTERRLSPTRRHIGRTGFRGAEQTIRLLVGLKYPFHQTSGHQMRSMRRKGAKWGVLK